MLIRYSNLSVNFTVKQFKYLYFIAILAISLPSALAQEVPLTELHTTNFDSRGLRLKSTSARPVRNYDNLIDLIGPHDVVKFVKQPRGKEATTRSFRLGKYLGEGNSNRIFALHEDPTKAIRLPLRVWSAEQQKLLFEALTGYVDTARSFQPFQGDNVFPKSDGVRAVEIFESGYGYAVVERISDFETFDQFMAMPDSLERKAREDAFLKFAESIFIFEYLGDFHTKQIVYSRAEGAWVLLDWNENTRRWALGASNPEHWISPFRRFLEEVRPARDWVDTLIGKGDQLIHAKRQSAVCGIGFSKTGN